MNALGGLLATFNSYNRKIDFPSERLTKELLWRQMREIVPADGVNWGQRLGRCTEP